MNYLTFRRIFPSLCTTLLFGLLLTGCGPASPQPTATSTQRVATLGQSTPTLEHLPNWNTNRVATVNALKTASATAWSSFNNPIPVIDLTPAANPSHPSKSPTPNFRLTWAADALTNPPPTATGTPIIDASGNVTWHPQRLLLSSSESGGDGVYYYQQNFGLYWDGTLMQPGGNDLGAPYVSKISQDEICKFLNTAETSGFFEEPNDYNFPFDGAGRGNITVNSWNSHSSSAQILGSALAGHPYYDNLFCRNCPIPSEETIIRPGMANMYFLLQNYRVENRRVAPVDRLHVTFSGKEPQASDKAWPLTSISLAQLWQDCNEPHDCYDSGMIVDGDVAQEIIKKMESGQTFSEQIFKSYSTHITYEASWPKVPNVPQDYTLTCNVNGASFPLLPLNRQNKFWYYAPGGKWAAESMDGENKIRVVNTSGYEKIYGYEASLFGQDSIQVYPRYWSADGQFFFVSILAGTETVGLQRIDVKNEKVSYVFIGTEKQSFAYAFSTDNKQIAYVRQGDQPLKLVIANAASGDEKSAYIASASIAADQYVDVNSIVWWRKDDKFYLAAIYQQDGRRKTHILVVDPANPVDMSIVTMGEDELKLIPDGIGAYSAAICPLSAGPYTTRCPASLNLETGNVGN